MNILWFTENYPPNKGGMARSCDRIIYNLRKHHTVDIYHFTNKNAPFFEEANVGGSYTPVPFFLDSSHTLNNLWAFLKSQDKINNSTVLVAFGSHLCIKGLPLIAKWLGKPLLTCFRGNDFDAAVFSSKKQDLLYAIEHSKAIACVTKEKVARITSMGLNENVYFTPNAIHLPDWKILKSDIELAETYRKKIVTNTTVVIGLIGYLKQKKGIDFFINCLVKSPLLNKVHLRIVGEIAPVLESRLQELKIPYSITVPSSKSELIANYLLCNAIAIPSIYDGMPNVVLEAGALNIPIIASNAGGLNDVLEEDNCFLFNVLSESGLINALTNFEIANKEEINMKCHNLASKINKQFTTRNEINEYLTILNNIL